MAKLQEAARTGDLNGLLAQVRNVDGRFDVALSRAGVPGVTAGARRDLLDRVASFETASEQRVTREQLQEIVEALLLGDEERNRRPAGE